MQFRKIHTKALELKFQGLTHRQIARRLQKSISTIDHWFSDPDFKIHYREYAMQAVKDIVKQNVPDAIRSLIKIMKNCDRSPTASRQAALDVLRMAGVELDPKAIPQGTVTEIVAHSTPAEARIFLENLYRREGEPEYTEDDLLSWLKPRK